MRLATHDVSAVSGIRQSTMSDNIRTQNHDSLYGQRTSGSTAVCRIHSALSHTVDMWGVDCHLEVAISWPGIGMNVAPSEDLIPEKQHTFDFPASTGRTVLTVSLTLPLEAVPGNINVSSMSACHVKQIPYLVGGPYQSHLRPT